jgi:hypothetical protein
MHWPSFARCYKTWCSMLEGSYMMKDNDAQVCEHMQRSLLLEQSGELSAAEREHLACHLRVCPACRAYRTDLAAMAELAAGAAAVRPAAPVMERVLQEAQTARPRGILSFDVPVYRYAALAAALLVIVTGALLLRGTTREDRIQTLSAMVAMIEEDTQAELGDGEEALRTLARQLLVMEGLDDDEWLTDSEALSVERLPTTSQWRSNPAFRGKICG